MIDNCCIRSRLLIRENGKYNILAMTPQLTAIGAKCFERIIPSEKTSAAEERIATAAVKYARTLVV